MSQVLVLEPGLNKGFLCKMFIKPNKTAASDVSPKVKVYTVQ